MSGLATWDGRSTFRYEGSVKQGTRITFGSNHSMTVSADQYGALLKHFQGRTVAVGTSRVNPPRGSLGEWLQANVSKLAVASYVAPILVSEGYAEKLPSMERAGRHSIKIF